MSGFPFSNCKETQNDTVTAAYSKILKGSYLTRTLSSMWKHTSLYYLNEMIELFPVCCRCRCLRWSNIRIWRQKQGSYWKTEAAWCYGKRRAGWQSYTCCMERWEKDYCWEGPEKAHSCSYCAMGRKVIIVELLMIKEKRYKCRYPCS